VDRRLTPAARGVAHVSLTGRVDAERFTEGETLRVQVPLVDLLRRPDGPRDRQLFLGDTFTVIDRDQGHAFGFSLKDGYCGWLPENALADLSEPTHWVASVGTHHYGEPRVQTAEFALPMGARVRVIGQEGKYAWVETGYVPASHLRAIGDWFSDPVSVAEMFLHTPYLWGGNSRAGLDCSGLVQTAHHACGMVMPGDADLQETAGQVVQGEFARGDLLFWKGHVAIVVDADRLIHANGHTMSVAYEPIGACIERIAAAEGLQLRSHRRP
jgi:cell wall-associated NlpC family hydrolase